MRTWILFVSVLTMSLACGGSHALPEEDIEVGDGGYTSGGSSGGAPDVWVAVEVGYCSVETYSLITGEYGEIEYVNEDGSDDPERIFGLDGEMLELFCDGSVVPRYDDPAAEVDPTGCAKVYCNPHGGTNRLMGEDDTCDGILWVYAYPEAYYDGDWAECGPWGLN